MPMYTRLLVKKSKPLCGSVSLVGAKNAVLVILASLLLTRGTSIIRNVPRSADVLHMIALLQELGACITFLDDHTVSVDTSFVTGFTVPYDIMRKMRASVLVMGPLLAQFGRAHVALPGGCVIGQRPIDLHFFGFKRLGASIQQNGEFFSASAPNSLVGTTIVLDYPSVGATENILMAAVTAKGTTRIINASLEPEVMDLLQVLKKMGAQIIIDVPATLIITGVSRLLPVHHTVMMDRLEAGTLLIAAAMTGGEIHLPDSPAYALDAVLCKLDQMGHHIETGVEGTGVYLRASTSPRAVSFKTGPYPGFPTDLQAPMMALQCLADGESNIEETVFENRLLHTQELAKMGARLTVTGNKVFIKGVERLYGTVVQATDIRASCALVIAGLSAEGETVVEGIHHWQRGYDGLEKKLQLLGGSMVLI